MTPLATPPRKASAALLGAGAGLLAIPVLTHRMPASFHAAAAWGLLLLLSLTGWGSGLARWLFPGRRVSWGLRAAWGMGAVLAAGGALLLAGWARPGPLVGLVALGLVLFFLDLGAARTAAPRTRPWVLAALALLYLLAATQALGWLLFNNYNPNDDLIAYLPLAKKLIQTGTLVDPFSLRRMAAYGGQEFLHALQYIAGTGAVHMHLMDRGVAFLVTAGLVLGHLHDHPKARAVPVLLAAAFLLSLPNTRVNTASALTGTACILGLFRTLSWCSANDLKGWRPAFVLALLAAGAGTLRQNYLLTVVLGLGLSYGVLGWRNRLKERPWVEPAWTFGLMLLFLAPWLWLSVRSNGTFLFPFVPGTYNRAYALLGARPGLLDQIPFFLDNAFATRPVVFSAAFFLAGLFVPDPSDRVPFRALLAAHVVGFCALLVLFPLSDVANLSRYYYAAQIATWLALGLACSTTPIGHRASRLALGFAALGLLVQGVDTLASAGRMYAYFGRRINLAVRLEVPYFPPKVNPAYAALQASLPPGAKVLVMVDDPWELDFRRNDILNVDVIGASGFQQGLDRFHGGEAMAAYLQDKGIRYVAFVRPEKARELYRRDIWERLARAKDLIWRQSSVYYLSAFDAFGELARTRGILYDADGLVALDLASAPRGIPQDPPGTAPGAGDGSGR